MLLCETSSHFKMLLKLTNLPVNCRGSPVPGQYGGMIDDGAMLGVVDDVHWNKLTAEWHHIQVSLKRHVLLQHLNQQRRYI